mgnify:CR=1 FL=1
MIGIAPHLSVVSAVMTFDICVEKSVVGSEDDGRLLKMSPETCSP